MGTAAVNVLSVVVLSFDSVYGPMQYRLRRHLLYMRTCTCTMMIVRIRSSVTLCTYVNGW